MADIDLSTEAPDTSISSGAFVFGADSQAAATPSVYPVDAVKDYVLTGALTPSSTIDFGTF